MSDRVAKSDPDSDGKATQSMNHYQAAWMDHWRRTNHKASSEVHSHSLHHHRPNQDDSRNSKQHPEIATDMLKSSQRFREVSEPRTVDNVKKNLEMGSMKLGREILDGQPFPILTNSGNRGSATSSKKYASISSNAEAAKYQINLNDAHNSSMDRSEWAYPKMECPSSSRECEFQFEGISRVPEQLAKSREFLDDVGSSSKIVPYVLNSRLAPLQSFTFQHDNCDQSSPVATSKQNFRDSKFGSYSTFWIHEKKAGAVMESRKLGSSCSRQNDAPLSLHDQSKNNSQLCSLLGKQSQKVENNSSIRLLPSSVCPEAMKSGKGYDGHFFLPRIPSSVHDVKTMRISTTIDSVEELPRGPSKFSTIDSVEELPQGPSKFSQTTHEFFITKKTGVNLTEGRQVFRDAIVSLNLKGNMFNDFLSLSPSPGFHGQQGLKLQPLESSTDSEGKDNVEDVRTAAACLKNESSVETDTMELDVLQNNQLSIVALCPPDQNIKGVHNSSLSETENATGEKSGNKMVNTALPDMNEELPALPAVANSINDGGISTSRTQSLDAAHLLCQGEQLSNSNTTSLGPDPCSRWVKRLKLSTSDPFALGTKSSKVDEVSSREKVKTTFSKIMNPSKTRSEPTIARSHVRPEVALDQTAMLLKNSYSTSSDLVKKSREISLSCSWIHRWCRHKAASPNKKPDAVVLCEPQGSKTTSDELEKKQFPSLAAMALMGKAMSGFHPCEFRRRGSLTVWST